MDASLFIPTKEELEQTRHEMRELLTRFPSFYGGIDGIRLHDIATVVKAARLIGLTPNEHRDGRAAREYRHSPKARFRYITESYLTENDVMVGIAIVTGEIELDEDNEPEYNICETTNWPIIYREASEHGLATNGLVHIYEPNTYSVDYPYMSYVEIIDSEDII